MRKLALITVSVILITVLTKCNSSRKAAASAPKITYTNTIQPLIADKCSPCHFPDKGGRIEALNTYASVKDEANEIIRRIELHPGDKGFMPFKRPRLSDSAINYFKQWKEAGFPEN